MSTPQENLLQSHQTPSPVDPQSMTLREYIDTAGDKIGVPKSLRDSIFQNETGFEHYDGAGRVKRSPKGARGVGQLMPATARTLGVDPDDPIQNAYGSLKLQKQLYDKYLATQGDPHQAAILTAAAYNSGEGNVDKYGGVPPFAETQGYVRKVAAHLRQHPITIQTPPPVAAVTSEAKPRLLGTSTPDPLIQEPASSPLPPNDMEFGGMSPAEKAMMATAQSQPNAIDNFSRIAMAKMAEQRQLAARRAQLQAKAAQARAVMAKKQGQGRIGEGLNTPSPDAMGSGLSSAPAGGNLRQLDDPEAARIIRLQNQVASEQSPDERVTGMAPGTANARLFDPKLTANEEALRRVAIEKGQEQQQADLARLAPRIRAEVLSRDYAQKNGYLRILDQLANRSLSEVSQVMANAPELVPSLKIAETLGPKGFTDAIQGAQSYLRDYSKVQAAASNYEPPNVTGGQQATKLLANMGFDVAKLTAAVAITKLPLSSVMVGESIAMNADKPAQEQIEAASKAYLIGRALEVLPEAAQKGLAKAPGIGKIVDAHPETAARTIAGVGFGAMSGTGEALAGGTRAQIAGATLGGGLTGAVLAGGGPKEIARGAMEYTVRSPLTPEPVKDVVANVMDYGRGLVKSQDGRNLSLYVDKETGKVFGNELTADQAKSYDPSIVTGEKRPVRNAKTVSGDEYDQLARALNIETKTPAKQIETGPQVESVTEKNITPKEIKIDVETRRASETSLQAVQSNRLPDNRLPIAGDGSPVSAASPDQNVARASDAGLERSIQEGAGAQPEPVRHVDLQVRDEEGKFDVETPAQAEARRQQVTQSVSIPQPEPATQASPATPDGSGVSVPPRTATEISKGAASSDLSTKERPLKIIEVDHRGNQFVYRIDTINKSGAPIALQVIIEKEPDGTIRIPRIVPTSDSDPLVQYTQAEIGTALMLRLLKELKARHGGGDISFHRIGSTGGKYGRDVLIKSASAAEVAPMPESTKGVVNEPKLQSVSKEELPLSSNQSQEAILGPRNTSSAEELRATDLPSSSRVDQPAPPVPEGKPLTEEKFYDSYYQHKVLRAGADLEKLKTEGWKGGIGPHALPAMRGDVNNVMQSKYGVKAGDTVLLVPREAIRDTPNGSKIKEGWKPKDSEIVIADRDNQPAYDLYQKGRAALSPKVESAPLGGVEPQTQPVEAAKVETSPAIQQAFQDWHERRAYIDGNGNYHVKGERKSGGPIAPWNKEVKRTFANVSEFHKAVEAHFTASSVARPTDVPLQTNEGQISADSEGTKQRSLPKTFEAAQMETGKNLHYVPESIKDDGVTLGKQLVEDKGVDGAIEFVKTGDGIEWASTGYEVLASLRDEEAGLRSSGHTQAADLVAEKRLNFLNDFTEGATRRGQSSAGIRAIEEYAPDRAVYIFNRTAMKRRGRGLSQDEEARVAARGQETIDRLDRDKALSDALGEIARFKAERAKTSRITKPRAPKADYQSKLSVESAAILESLKPKIGKFDFGSLTPESSRFPRQSGKVGPNIGKLPGDAEALAQYAAGQLGVLNTVAELNAHMIKEFGAEIEPHLSAIRQRAFQVRADARIAEIEAKDTVPERRRTILQEIQTEIRDAGAEKKAWERYVESHKAAEAIKTQQIDRAQQQAETLTQRQERLLREKADRSVARQTEREEVRRKQLEHRAAQALRSQEGQRLDREQRKRAHESAKDAWRGEAEAKNRLAADARQRLKDARREYQEASEAETKGYRASIAAQKEAKRTAALWDTPIRTAATEARTRLAVASNAKDVGTMSDLVSVAAEKLLPEKPGGAPRAGPIAPAKFYVEMKDEFPSLVSDKNKGKIYKQARLRIQDMTKAAREAAAMRNAGTEAQRFWDKEGVDIDAQSVLIQKAENQRLLNEVRRQQTAELNRVSRGPIRRIASEIENIPRALQTTLNMHQGRQGLFYIMTHPLKVTARSGIPGTFKGYGALRRGTYRERVSELMQHPSAQRFKRLGGNVSELPGTTEDARIAIEEDELQSTVAMKLPWVRLSNQGFALGMNSERIEGAHILYGIGDAFGLTERTDPKFYRQATEFVNTVTGRTTMGKKMNALASFTNHLFYATRLNVSRVRMINDLFNPLKYLPTDWNPADRSSGGRSDGTGWNDSYHEKLRWPIMKEAIKITMVIAALATAAKLLLHKELDNPEDPDEFKLVFGHTHYDLSGGIGTDIRFAYHMVKTAALEATGHTVSENQQLLRSADRFLRQKYGPWPSAIRDWFEGKNAVGEPANFKVDIHHKMDTAEQNIIVRMLFPIVAHDFAKGFSDDGWLGAAKELPVLAGFGAQTYEPKHQKPEALTPKEPNIPAAVRDKVDKEFKRLDIKTGSVQQSVDVLTELEQKEVIRKIMESDKVDRKAATELLKEKNLLPQAELDKFNQTYQENFYRLANQLITNDQFYSRLKDFEKEDRLDRVKKIAHTIARREIKTELKTK